MIPLRHHRRSFADSHRFVVWWICLFIVLPFGVRNQVDAGESCRAPSRARR